MHRCGSATVATERDNEIVLASDGEVRLCGALWRHAKPIACKVNMLWRAGEPPPLSCGDGDTRTTPIAPRCREYLRGPEIAATIRRKHAVARRNIFDSAQRSIGHRDLRARNQTLIVIAHGADIHMAGRFRCARRQQPHQFILRRVGILKLIHMHVAIAALVVAQNVGVAAPQTPGEQNQVIKIHRIAAAQLLIIARKDTGGDLLRIAIDTTGELLG